MSPPILGIGENCQSNGSVVISAPPVDNLSPNDSGLKERNYLGLSGCSSVDSSAVPSPSGESKSNLNLKATELRLGLPGSQSPERELDEKPLFPLLPSKDGIFVSAPKNSNNKRVFSEKWITTTPKASEELPHAATGASAAKAQVVGWPPIRSFRKNTLATSSSKNNDEVDGKPTPGSLFVKVSMDGAPYLRKVDLRTYSTYQDLSSALEKMFSCFTLGQCGSHGAPGREMLSESKLRDLLHGSEYVLTYEDKDKDWMLVGDVPWEMFIDSCKRLKIMKGSDAIGLAPRAMEKSKNRN